jgi:WD40 repeat protein
VAVPGISGELSLFSVTGTSTFGPEIFMTPSYYDVTAGFSPNGTLLAVGDGDSYTNFWNFPVPSATTPPTGAEISIGSTGSITDNVYGLAFSPNGTYIAITGGYNQGSVSIWNVASRSMVSRFNMPAGHIGQSVAFSPSGSALVVGERGCGKLTVCSY